MPSPFSVDKKYVDQHGVDYLYIGFHPSRTTHPFVFTRKDDIGVFVSDEKGNILWSTNKTLREVKPKITLWVSVYKDPWNGKFCLGTLTQSREKALKRGIANQAVACLKVEFEEGEGL